MRTVFSYDRYCLQEEIEERVKKLAQDHPDIMQWEELLETPGGHHILAVTLTNRATGEAKDKPAFYIDGCTHAGEVTGMMAAMYAMDMFATGYGEDPEITFLLDHMAVYIVPCVSPDGAQAYLTTPYRLRSVDRPGAGYNESDKNDGLGQEDVDGDGVIRMMRVKTPYGAWKKDPAREHVMVRREPCDIEGEFYNVYTEGDVKGYNGLDITMRREKWSRDFNRNYPYGWFPEHRQPGAGEYPLCVPETRTVAQFVAAHKNIGSVATGHTSGGILLKVPGTCPEKKAPAEDMKLLAAIGDLGKKITGYDHINLFDTFVRDQENYDSGAFDDYCYETQGIYAMTLEMWDLDARCGIKHHWEEKPTPASDSENFAKRLAWIGENAPGDFKPWTPFEHPQLGPVEIGGFNFKFTVQNPPVKFLPQECEKIAAYYLKWALSLPRLVIDKVEATPLGDGLYRLEAVVSNAGFLPTYLSRKAKAVGTAGSVKVTAEVDGEIVSGEKEQDIGDLSSYGLIPTGARFYGNITTMNGPAVTKKVTWLYRGKSGSACVTASSPKAGTVTAKTE